MECEFPTVNSNKEEIKAIFENKYFTWISNIEWEYKQSLKNDPALKKRIEENEKRASEEYKVFLKKHNPETYELVFGKNKHLQKENKWIKKQFKKLEKPLKG